MSTDGFQPFTATALAERPLGAAGAGVGAAGPGAAGAVPGSGQGPHRGPGLGPGPHRGPVPTTSAAWAGSASPGAPATTATSAACASSETPGAATHSASEPRIAAFQLAPEAADVTRDPSAARAVSFQSVQQPTAKEEAARESGYSAGFAAGWAAASREEAEAVARRVAERTEQEERAIARLEQMRGALTMARETARSMVSPQLQMHADEITMAAISLAEDLVGSVLRDERRRVAAALQRALAIEEDAGVVRIRMNPEDVAHYRELSADPEIVALVPEGVDLVADPSLQPGDAVTELDVGFVDARLSSALDRVRSEVQGADAAAELPR